MKVPEGIYCLTLDEGALGHVEQARRLCAGGARLVQLRMKTGTASEMLAVSKAFVGVCRAHSACAIINDHVHLALEAGADGVHLGRTDLGWRKAREILGAGAIIGGTVNYPEDVERVRREACLDYVGIGPLRFTRTKSALAPVLGLEGIQSLMTGLEGLPCYVIGGVTVEDLTALRALGARGAAVCGELIQNGKIEENYQRFENSWKL